MTPEVRRAAPRARSRSYLGGAALLVVALVALIGWLWWRGAFIGVHDVDARVTFTGREGSELQGLRLIAGADKAYWPVIRAGETARTRLLTAGVETSLTMQLTFQGEQVNWHGPSVPAGAGYRITIQIDAAGRISEQHCLLPCPMW